MHVPAMRVLEDFCEGGRAGGIHLATEVTVVPHWRLIYIDNKKAGSSTISSILWRYFNSTGFYCDGAVRADPRPEEAARLRWCTVLI